MDAHEWIRSPIDSGGPYTVWKSPAMPWFCVVDKNGVNVMKNTTKAPGGIFTTEETAKQLAEAWNG